MLGVLRRAHERWFLVGRCGLSKKVTRQMAVTFTMFSVKEGMNSSCEHAAGLEL
jgi:hypothetical protein